QLERLPADVRDDRHAHGSVTQHALFAVAAPGLEDVVARELAALPVPVRDPVVTTGGVDFTGDDETLVRPNLWLRAATRVRVRLGEVKARDFAKLRSSAAELPWEQFIDGPVTVEQNVTAHRSRLYHTGAIAERILGAIADRLAATKRSAIL